MEPDERAEFLAARYQHISTIETTSAVASPSRVRQPQVGVGDAYAGFCTLRNGMPLRDLAMVNTTHAYRPHQYPSLSEALN